MTVTITEIEIPAVLVEIETSTNVLGMATPDLSLVEVITASQPVRVEVVPQSAYLEVMDQTGPQGPPGPPGLVEGRARRRPGRGSSRPPARVLGRHRAADQRRPRRPVDAEGGVMAEERPVRPCDVCGQEDDHPRHVIGAG